jgi:hypothetical protein
MKDVVFVLFLNKRDLLADKLAKQKVQFNAWFNEYTGDNSYNSVTEWIKNRFLSLNKNPNRKIFTHLTCATDTGNIKTVLDAVQRVVLQVTLQQSGLLE